MTNSQWELVLAILQRPSRTFFGPPRWVLNKRDMDALRALVTLYRQERG